MKKSLLKIAMITVMLFSVNLIAQAAPTPTTPGVKILCSGEPFKLAPAIPGTTWEVRYSATQTNTPTTGIALDTDGLTTTPTLETGYYYIYSKNTTTGCISEAQEVPFYVFKPLSVTIGGLDAYCIENANTPTALLTADITTDDTYANFAYQWYIVDGTTETAIPSAIGKTYTPIEKVAGTTTTYKFKVGYLVGTTDKYCPAQQTKIVTVTTPPAKPIITITNTPVTW